MAVDLDLSSQLEHYVVVDYLFLSDHLYGHYSLCSSMSSQVHMPILPLTQMPANLKVINAPVTRVEDLPLGLSLQV